VQAKVKRLHYILTGLTLVVAALSLNRLAHLTLGYVPPHEFLRWLDLNAMIPIPIAAVALYYLLMKNIQGNGRFHGGRAMLWLELTLLSGVALYAISAGDHETTNYLHGRYCADPQLASGLCEAISYHDDTFSHLLYYAGVVLITGALLGIERLRPRMAPIHGHDLVLILMNAGLIAAGIFANLAFERTNFDLVAFTVLALAALIALVSARVWVGRLPVTIYLATAYGVGLVATLAYKLVAR
jgi:hypothetical protein